ncbi:tail fiber domain-containing protein [Vibrio parahaemolyticus]|uniref:tail fiber domain-containing protein n=1 Tax=Vibrio parahaemolyticus TaxID=670 RepID=UPI003D817E95
MSGQRRHEEAVLIPPTINEIESLPLIADTQYLEPNSSESLNRKLCGIVEAGVYRGFNVAVIGNTMTVNVTSGQQYGVAMVERDGYLLTIRQQHDVVLTVPIGRSYAVIDAIYQHGLITKQIDIRSAYDAASLKIVQEGKLQAHHVILASFDVPAGTLVLDESYMSFNQRMDGGLDLARHIAAHDPHKQYMRVDSAATDADIDNKSKSPKPVLLPQLWRGIEQGTRESLGNIRVGVSEGLTGGGALADGLMLGLAQATTTKLGGVRLTSDLDSDSAELAAAATALKALKAFALQVGVDAAKYTDNSIQTLLGGTDPEMLKNLEALIKELEANESILDSITGELAKKLEKTALINTSGALTGGGQLGSALTLSVLAATLQRAGVVQLSSAIDSTSEERAATPKAVKDAVSVANTKMPKAGGRFTGNTALNDNVKLLLGNDNDLGLYFNGTSAFLDALSGFKLNMRKGSADRFVFDFETGNLTLSGDLQGLSDKRIKKNFQPLTDAINKIMQLNGYDYQLKQDDSWHTGVIAQEVAAVLPNVVKAGPDGKLSVAYGNMVALLIEGIKQQQSTIGRLEDRLSLVEAAVKELLQARA